MYTRAVLLAWSLAILGGCLLAYDMAHAEPYITLGGGFTVFRPTTADGDFWQQGFPHSYKSMAPAFKVGVGWEFNNQWATELRYVNLGNNGYTQHQFVGDEWYDSKAHRCRPPCTVPGSFVARDYVQGVDLTVLRTFTDYAYRPFVRLGAALMLHRLDVNIQNPTIAGPDSQQFIRTDGRMPMAVAGIGVKRGHFTLETTFYYGLGGSNCLSPCGFPQSTQFMTTMVGFNW